MINVSVPCPQCGESLDEAPLKENISCRCGFQFRLEPLMWTADEMAWPDFTAALVGVWIWPALILLRETSSLAAMAISLPVFVGAGLVIRFTTVNLLRAIERVRQNRWLRSEDARRYADYSSRRDGIVRAQLASEEAERREQEGRFRSELAENAAKQEYLLDLSPGAFEEHVGKLFFALGYSVRLTPKSNDKVWIFTSIKVDADRSSSVSVTALPSSDVPKSNRYLVLCATRKPARLLS